jgi:hypothetical protein
MRRRELAAWLVIAIGAGGCAWMSLPTTAEPAYESTACGMTREGPDGKPWFYPPRQREACLRVLRGLAELTAQHARGQLSELAFLVRAVTLLKGADALAVLAASTAPNGGWLGEHKHAYEQALEAAGRSASARSPPPTPTSTPTSSCRRQVTSQRLSLTGSPPLLTISASYD